MDIHLSDHGASTADKVHEREEFRLLVGDIHELPETQKTALVLREMDALSYEQIAEAMETTVPSVKSLLVRARVSLAEAAEARLLSCDEVRIELGEVAEGLRRRPSPLGPPPPASLQALPRLPRPAARRPTRRSPRSCRSGRWSCSRSWPFLTSGTPPRRATAGDRGRLQRAWRVPPVRPVPAPAQRRAEPRWPVPRPPARAVSSPRATGPSRARRRLDWPRQRSSPRAPWRPGTRATRVPAPPGRRGRGGL